MTDTTVPLADRLRERAVGLHCLAKLGHFTEHTFGNLLDAQKELHEAAARIRELEATLDKAAQEKSQRNATAYYNYEYGEPDADRIRDLEQYLVDTSEDLDCLPGCDSYGHEDDCPQTNPMAAFRRLRSRIRELEAALDIIQQQVDLQAEDEGLWFIAETAPEAYLQQELRKLHAVVERELLK